MLLDSGVPRLPPFQTHQRAAAGDPGRTSGCAGGSRLEFRHDQSSHDGYLARLHLRRAFGRLNDIPQCRAADIKQIPNKHQTKNKQRNRFFRRRAIFRMGDNRCREGVMKKAIGAEIEKSLEAEIGRNIRELNRPSAVPHPASAEPEMMTDNLGTLFRRMTNVSIGEVENLIDQLHRLRKQLEGDNDLIEQAIARHSEHSQGVMQLTAIIADTVKGLPNPK